MLQQKQQTLPYIGVFKLTSGEEFIAKVIDETMISLTVSKPLCMVPTERGLQFAPLMMMADLESTVQIPKPVIQSKPNDKLLGQYESATTGIALPQKQSIIA